MSQILNLKESWVNDYVLKDKSSAVQNSTAEVIFTPILRHEMVLPNNPTSIYTIIFYKI